MKKKLERDEEVKAMVIFHLLDREIKFLICVVYLVQKEIRQSII